MADSILHQVSDTLLDSFGIPKFRVLSSIPIATLNPAHLPFAEIFLHQIVSATDPKQDKFLRVANIHDLTAGGVFRTREKAINNNKTTYLATSFAVQFDDVTTGVAAKEVVQTRVDALINDWIQFSTKFLVPVDFDMPAPEPTLVTAAKLAFATAKANNITAQAAKVTAEDVKDEADAEASRKAVAYVDALQRTNACSQRVTQVTTLKTKEDDFRAAMDAFRAQAQAFLGVATAAAPDVTAFTNAIANAVTALSTQQALAQPLLNIVGGTGVGSIFEECGLEQLAVTQAAGFKESADTAAATAATNLVVATAAATAAQNAENAAHIALAAICPDFDFGP